MNQVPSFIDAAPLRAEVAQTNTDLYAQLSSAGYREADMQAVQKAYEFAMLIHAGAYRPCGRAFISHLSGTTSVLAACRAPTSLLQAALLHAAYMSGDFWFALKVGDARRREVLRDRVGSDVDELAWYYADYPWNDVPEAAAALERISSRAASAREIQILILRLANDLDEIYQRERNYSAKVLPDRELWRPVVIAAARSEGLHRLAEIFDEACLQESGVGACGGLKTSRTVSFSVRPPRESLRTRLARQWRRLSGKDI